MSNNRDKYRGEAHQGPDATAPYPVSRMAPAVELVDIAKEIADADSRVTQTASAKLRVIADQIRALQEEARQVLNQAQTDQALHRAQCNFKRIPGKIYHLYRRDGERCYFSMLGPEEWGGAPPHEFVGSYRLENDRSWTAVEDIEQEVSREELVRRLLEDKGLLPKE